MDADLVIEAIGQEAETDLAALLPGVALSRDGMVEADRTTMMTGRTGVFAGGDMVNGGSTVVQAVVDGQKAAEGIDKYLKKKG
jgi:NADPH-dependent glutamate synthase beta subunit-like oxidoreductase